MCNDVRQIHEVFMHVLMQLPLSYQKNPDKMYHHILQITEEKIPKQNEEPKPPLNIHPHVRVID